MHIHLPKKNYESWFQKNINWEIDKNIVELYVLPCFDSSSPKSLVTDRCDSQLTWYSTEGKLKSYSIDTRVLSSPFLF